MARAQDAGGGGLGGGRRVTRVLVLTALDLEARTLARHLGLPQVPGHPWPHFRSDVLEVASVGLRAADIDARVAECRTPTLMIAAGACGALSPELREGALVVPETVTVPGSPALVTDDVPALRRAGSLVTVNSVVETATAKARLWRETGALAVDMESAPIVAWARQRRWLIAVLRGVSDTAARGVPADLAGVVDAGGHLSARRAVRVMLARPRAVSDAFVLCRGTATALRNVAAALAQVARAA
ncbi:MAG: hypothetical protein DMD81_13920 [Candidatus Rokuibacteriota bacterium]|nr:MAG: hypothetical protein DMD81_13920 [Candidatus Rokubacteria bacterium]